MADTTVELDHQAEPAVEDVAERRTAALQPSSPTATLPLADRQAVCPFDITQGR